MVAESGSERFVESALVCRTTKTLAGGEEPLNSVKRAESPLDHVSHRVGPRPEKRGWRGAHANLHSEKVLAAGVEEKRRRGRQRWWWWGEGGWKIRVSETGKTNHNQMGKLSNSGKSWLRERKGSTEGKEGRGEGPTQMGFLLLGVRGVGAGG